jgi:diguanylate cyclase (GGDEF)-like protein
MVSVLSRRLVRWSRALVIALASGAVLVLWTVFLLTTLGDRDRSVTLETERLVRAARVFTSGVDHLLGEGRLALGILVRTAAAHPHTDQTSSEEFLSVVRAVRNHADGELDVRAVDRMGYLHYFAGDGTEGRVSVADRDYYRVQVPFPGVGYYIGAPVQSRFTGVWGLTLSQALPPQSGNLAVLHLVLDYPRLDRLVASLADDPGETVALYRADGTLLYNHPRPHGYPTDLGTNDWVALRALGVDTGVLTGSVFRAFQRGEEGGVVVVVSRPATTLAASWEAAFRFQLAWMVVLTALVLASASGLWIIQGRLSHAMSTQEELARIDPLTGLLNRRAFLEQCAVERIRVDRKPSALSLALLDLDHFKQVNDTFGHLVGDQALRDFGAALVRTLRATDLMARIGGEEFAVLLPDTDGPRAQEIAERLRTEVEAIPLPEGHLSTSIGVAVWDGAESFDAWYHRADQALYQAKDQGRNQVVDAEG